VVVDCEMGRWSGDGQAECGGGDAEVGIGLDAPTPDLNLDLACWRRLAS